MVHLVSERRELEREYYDDMRKSCKTAVDKTVDYLEGIESHRPFPQIEPGFLIPQIPRDPPKDGVSMDTIFKDVDKYLLPGVRIFKNSRWFTELKPHRNRCALRYGQA